MKLEDFPVEMSPIPGAVPVWRGMVTAEQWRVLVLRGGIEAIHELIGDRRVFHELHVECSCGKGGEQGVVVGQTTGVFLQSHTRRRPNISRHNRASGG